MDKIAILDFGSQYAHLIANRVRKLGVYTEIFEGDVEAGKLAGFKGIILSGGPSSVSSEDAVLADAEIFGMGVPILGICYGHQILGHMLGGKVQKGEYAEYGHAEVKFSDRKALFADMEEVEHVWMSHFDQVVEPPEGFDVVGSSDDCNIVAMVDEERNFYGIQFHPEVTHTKHGMKLLEKFVEITGASRDWSIDNYIEEVTAEIVAKVGDKKVFLMISGGVDSTVAFLLLVKALGQDRVYGLFVDTGFMRLNERDEVESALKGVGVSNLHVYDASDEYFEALAGVYEPEAKRKIIGELFLDIQQKVSDELELNPDEWMLGQGTIYPDTIETGGTKHSHTIKTHHNRVQRVQEMMAQGKVIEPLAQLYKDEVRELGAKLGLVQEMVWRHPFPGPGLAVRCLCSEGEDYPEGMEELEAKLNEAVAEDGLKAKVMPIKSVGVQGDERTYRHPVLLYGERVSWDRLNTLSTQLTNQFSEINRAVLLLSKGDVAGLSSQKCDMNRGRILTNQKADSIVMNYLKKAGLHEDVWQVPTCLIPVSVNSQMDSHYRESVVLRPVCSREAMTANFYRMDWDKLDELVAELEGLEEISGVMYDITNKPPGTIEWE